MCGGFRLCCGRCWIVINKNKFILLLLLGAISGTVIGIVMRNLNGEPFHSRHVMYAGFLGEIFMSIIQALTLPMAVVNMIGLLATLDAKVSEKLGVQLIIMSVLNKIIVAALALVLVLTIRPGDFEVPIVNDTDSSRNELVPSIDKMLDFVRNMFPTNLVEMMVARYKTELIPPDDPTIDIAEWELTPDGTVEEVTNVIGVINMAIIFGIVVRKWKEVAYPLVHIFDSLTEISMIMFQWMLFVSPIMLTSLITSKIMESTYTFDELMSKMGYFIICNMSAFLIVCVPLNALNYVISVRGNPWPVFLLMCRPSLMALATDSTEICITVTMTALIDDGGYDSRIVRYVVPVCHVVNKDGSVMYLIITTVFIAQSHNITLTIGEYVFIVVISLAGSVIAPGLPLANIIFVTLITGALNLHDTEIGMLIALDWFLDRFSTMCSVLSDGFTVAALAHSVTDLGEEPKMDEEAIPGLPRAFLKARRAVLDVGKFFWQGVD